MAGTYSLALSTYTFGVPASNLPLFELLPLLIARPKIFEVFINITPAMTTVFDVGIGTSTSGVPNPIYTQVVVAEDGGSNSAIQFISSTQNGWSTPPAIPSGFFRESVVPVTTGVPATIQWQFPRGLTANSTQSLSIWMVAGTASSNVVVWDASIVLEC